MSDSATVKLRIGVQFSAREIELEVAGGADDVLGSVEAALERGDRTIRFTGEKGRRTVIPVDKLAYVDCEDDSTAGPIGFGR